MPSHGSAAPSAHLSFPPTSMTGGCIAPSGPRPFLGIDPGLGGALAVYTLPHATFGMVPVEIHDMPLTPKGQVDAVELATLVRSISISHPGIQACVELVASRPRQAGAFNFGLSTGIVLGCLAAAGVPYTQVAPSVWKRQLGLARTPGESYQDNKARARALATQLWPYAASQFSRVKDDGRAEALLLALHLANQEPHDPNVGLPIYE
jgi:crossover junction endodeoxyribonuclease RuvC